MLQRSTLQLLRFHFSLFLLPVYLFAISQVNNINWPSAILIFVILHALVYPSSNGYNSYMDRDETPIGGLSKPMQPTRQLYYTSLTMDIIAIGISLFISIYFSLGILIYILASRAYSYRGIRLKKYPIIGYLTVILFQGAEIFMLTYYGSSQDKTFNMPLASIVAAACLIGGYYPLTQVYQHKEDMKDGVKTISYMLGKRGTFLFCAIVFSVATVAMYITFQQQNNPAFFWLFIICMLPMALFFSWWMIRVWKNSEAANFKNSLVMNLLASVCSSIGFFIMLVQKQF